MAKGKLGKARAGGIIRNNYGKGIAMVVAPLGTQTNHYAEAIVAHYIIKLAKDMGVRKLWLEGDLKNFIDCLNEKNKPTWTTENIIQECILLLKIFEEIYVAHEYQKANQVADSLANWAIKYNEMAKWTKGNKLPSNIKDMIKQERIPGRLGIIKNHYER